MSNPNQLSVIDRLGNTSVGRFVTAHVAALGLFAAGGAATYAALNAERANGADNIPTGESEMLGTQASCREEMLRFPQVVKKIPGTSYWGTAMINPGEYRQNVGVMINSRPVSDACKTKYQLRGQGTGFLSSNRGHNKPGELYKIGGLAYGNRGGENQVNWANQASSSKDDFKCGDSVWLRLVSKVVKLGSQRVIGEATKWTRIPVINADGSDASRSVCK